MSRGDGLGRRAPILPGQGLQESGRFSGVPSALRVGSGIAQEGGKRDRRLGGALYLGGGEGLTPEEACACIGVGRSARRTFQPTHPLHDRGTTRSPGPCANAAVRVCLCVAPASSEAFACRRRRCCSLPARPFRTCPHPQSRMRRGIRRGSCGAGPAGTCWDLPPRLRERHGLAPRKIWGLAQCMAAGGAEAARRSDWCERTASLVVRARADDTGPVSRRRPITGRGWTRHSGTECHCSEAG